MPGGGDFCFVFLTWGPEFCTEKISGPAVSPGGMVTGQIDTCIMCM